MSNADVRELKQARAGALITVELRCVSETMAQYEDQAVFLYKEHNGMTMVEKFYKVVRITAKK